MKNLRCNDPNIRNLFHKDSNNLFQRNIDVLYRQQAMDQRNLEVLPVFLRLRNRRYRLFDFSKRKQKNHFFRFFFSFRRT